MRNTNGLLGLGERTNAQKAEMWVEWKPLNFPGFEITAVTPWIIHDLLMTRAESDSVVHAKRSLPAHLAELWDDDVEVISTRENTYVKCSYLKLLKEITWAIKTHINWAWHPFL